MKVIFNKNIYLILLVVCILSVFYPLTLFIHPLKWDMIDCALPWRFVVGESVHNGYLPMWNAYQSMGYPLHADMQTIPWYLPVWILSGIMPFTLAALQIEFLFHVSIAGIGMYWLLRNLKTEVSGSGLLAISYALSGVIVGNAQHYHHIITAAWLPFVICSFYRLLKAPTIYRTIVFSLFSWLIFTGGYLGHTFVILYAFIGWFILHQIRYYLKNKHLDISVSKSVLLALMMIALLSLPQLVSIMQSLPYITRSNGIPLESAQYGAFTPVSFLSFLFPYATAKDSDWLRTDISMANIYFGICALSLVILGLFQPGKRKWILLIIIISALLVSLGKYTPARAFLYNHVPLMNYSRFPAINRIFAVIPMILLASLGLELLSGNFSRYIKYLRWIILGLLIIVVSISCSYLTVTDFHPEYFLSMSINDAYPFIDHKQQLIFQAIIQSVILISVLVFSFFIGSGFKNWIRIFLFISIIDVAIAVNLNAPFTTYANDYSFSSIFDLKKHFAYDYNQYHTYKISETDSICKSQFSPLLWRNTSNLNKHVYPGGFTSFNLKNYQYLLESQKGYLDSLQKNKLCFISEDVRSSKTYFNVLKMGNYCSTTVFIDNPGNLDTNYLSLGDVKNIKINPYEISMIIENQKTNALLVLLQNHYPYWKVYINDQMQPLLLVSNTFMGVKIDSKSKNIVFKYDNKAVRISFYLSFAALVIILTAMIFYRKRLENILSFKSKVS